MDNCLLKKVRNGEDSVRIYLSDTNAMSVELAAYAGFDYVRIDTEHTLVSTADLKSMLQTADAVGVPALVRIANVGQITQLLDYGASGVLVPDVETKEYARELANLCKYEPLGIRGMSTTCRAVQYGNMPIDQYMKTANERVCLGIQIESQRGLDNIDDILSVKGVDLVAVGRQDLSQSLGYAGQTSHPAVVEAENMVIKKHWRRGKFISELL
ncbi:hypothetical protein AGMMS50276_32030 [Synergistales bacterium]|nr:hypothetical protein AGMMS50276_32030 [Synergistales bacterium]